MTYNEAKQVFLSRGYVEVEGGKVYDANKWRESCRVISDWLEQEPCEDAISRRAVIDMTGLSEWFDSSDSYNEFVIALSELPSATPQPKMGHWIAQDIHNCHTDFKCSECGYIHNFMHIFGEPIADYTYCPNCGAKMVEPQESEK